MPRRSRKKTAIVNTAPVIPEEDFSGMTPSQRRLHERLAEYEPRPSTLPEGVTEEEFWTPEPYEPTDWSNPLITDEYEHFELPADCPRFRVLHHARAEWKTDAQHAVDRYDAECYYFGLSISLWIAQWAATYVGLYNSCPLKACRRAKQCVSRRAEDDWTVYPGPWMPPCCNNHERTELIRYMVLIKLEQEEELQAGR
ncbi:hypothetical protein KEU06_13995 [Pseudaminobacter sp. 19-2017]|uniref:Uncharacterized protein n=1 Tax=Pseudaminobacter soli (ex Zhang et al. 2022) TaxID=2831468 RepID=A0A942E2A9_9HYPH|nr:hypothetical protein [Pseudaminobacter soli]MBS3649721.1 hypothetical protein [Pseudaminobacter soli]